MSFREVDLEKNTGFILWHGVVVDDIFDPLKMGRVRVRIIGWHNLNEKLMPTNTLPWATIAKSPTGANQTTNLVLGDWVTGFFLDGLSAQKPVIIGKYDGINIDRASGLGGYAQFAEAGGDSPLISYFTSQYNVELTPEQIKILESYPKPALNIKTSVDDRPLTPLLSQGIVEGTAVGVANENRAHVCDISARMRNDAAIARIKFSQLTKAIREAIRAVLKALGFSPDSESSRFIELAKDILAGVQFLQRIIDEIKDYSQVLINYAKQIRAMIDWLLSLPKNLAALLKDCLNELLNAAGAAFSELFNISGANEIGESIKTVTDLITESKQLVNSGLDLLTVPSRIVDALSTPASVSDINSAGNKLISFVSEFSTSNNSTSKIQMA